MSAHLVPNPSQDGQSNPKATNDNSLSPPPPMEMKPLSSHLKYAYLDNEQLLPVIIANNLHQEQEEKLLNVLRYHKKAIGWKLFDLLGINLSICMHRILMEEEAKPIRQHQRRLNLTIVDMVSPVQVVPKKSKMTIMKNQHDEPIHIALEDQHKTTFTFPFGTFAYTRMPFGLCNVPNTNLVLNFEKFHFMVNEGIVLGLLVSNRGIKVDKSKINIITSLPNPASVREELKNRLTSAPILQAPNWELPFELMCDTSNSVLGAVLGKRAGVGKLVHVIVYASRTMDPAQLNYTTTEKELLAIVFGLNKFRPYLLGSKIIIFFDHATLRFLLKKPNAKPRQIQWMLLLLEFNIEIKDKKGVENFVVNHLSRIAMESDPMPIRD
ncbi:Retrovirus-related Pol polyprotein, partial [Mucuna pruriens]